MDEKFFLNFKIIWLLFLGWGFVLPATLHANHPENNFEDPSSFAYTHQTPHGNRLVRGHGTLPKNPPLDIPLRGTPHWVVALPQGEDSVWIVTLVNGVVQAFLIAGGSAQPIDGLSNIPRQMPPLAYMKDHTPTLLLPPTRQASLLTHPILLPETQQQVFIERGGDLVFWKEREVGRLKVRALPDARILRDEKARLLLLTAPTNRYGHGVLGDQLEASSITLIETIPSPQVVLIIDIPEPDVIEGLAPIWADLNGDGQREIIVTMSNEDQGAWLVVFNDAGEKMAQSSAIGRGNRWRDQLVVAPIGPKGELELVDVLTPHLGGVLEFFQWSGKRLQLKTTIRGHTSHVIGSRNLGMAVAGDFDHDHRVELLLPNQSRTQLSAIRRTLQGAQVAWHLPIGGQMSTNIATITFPNDSLAVGVGHDEGVLRIWLP